MYYWLNPMYMEESDPAVYNCDTFTLPLSTVSDITTDLSTSASCSRHRKKNESCVTQANTGYRAKAKFILTLNGHSQINTVYCVTV